MTLQLMHLQNGGLIFLLYTCHNWEEMNRTQDELQAITCVYWRAKDDYLLAQNSQASHGGVISL